MRRARTLVLNAAILTASSLLINTLAMYFNVYISNRLGPEAMGLFQLIMSVYMFAVTLATSGAGLASTRLVAEESAKRNTAGIGAAVKRLFIYALFFSTLAAILLSSNSELIAVHWLHSAAAARPLFVISFSLPFIAVSSVIHGYFTAVQRVARAAVSGILEQLIRVFVITGLLGIFIPSGLDKSFLALCAGIVISEGVSCMYMLLIFFIDRNGQRAGNGRGITKRMLGIALPVAFSTYLRSALGTMKQVLTPLRLEKSGVSCDQSISSYGIIRGMVMPVLLFPSSFLAAFGSLLVPEIAKFNVLGRRDKIETVIRYILKVTLLFSVCVCGIIFAYGTELGTALYHNPDAAFFIKALSPLIPVMYFDGIVDGMLKGLDEQVSVVRINIIDAAVSLVLIYFLLPVYGIGGYIAAIYISEILNAILSIRRLLKTAACEINITGWIVKPGIAITCALLITRLFTIGNLVINIITALILYLTMLFALGCITKKDLTTWK